MTQAIALPAIEWHVRRTASGNFPRDRADAQPLASRRGAHLVFDFELGRGVGAVFIYVMMRTFYQPGPKTAAGAALMSRLISSMSGPAQFIPLGFCSEALWVKAAAYQLVTSVAATLAGASIYRDARR
jgi:hypothetical protein